MREVGCEIGLVAGELRTDNLEIELVSRKVHTRGTVLSWHRLLV